MSLFHPTLSFQSVAEITKEHLDVHHVKGLIIDIDNTLTLHNSQEISEEIQEWIEKMKKEYPIVLLSNNHAYRVEPFADMLELDYIFDGGKPLPFKGLKKAAGKLDLPRERLAVIGDQIFTDILGGNLCKSITIHVEPMELEGGFFFHVKRLLEKIVRKRAPKNTKDIKEEIK